MHAYVNFYNVLTESFYDGFIVLDEKYNPKLCYPIAYLLLEKQNKLDVLNDSSKTNFPIDVNILSDGIYQKSERPSDDKIVKDLTWILDFSIEEKHIPYLNQIATFFEHIVHHSHNFDYGLAQGRSSVGRAAPADLITELELFAISHH